MLDAAHVVAQQPKLSIDAFLPCIALGEQRHLLQRLAKIGRHELVVHDQRSREPSPFFTRHNRTLSRGKCLWPLRMQMEVAQHPTLKSIQNLGDSTQRRVTLNEPAFIPQLNGKLSIDLYFELRMLQFQMRDGVASKVYLLFEFGEWPTRSNGQARCPHVIPGQCTSIRHSLRKTDGVSDRVLCFIEKAKRALHFAELA